MCSDWRRTGPSHFRPSQSRSSKIRASNSGRQRPRSMSSIRSMKAPAGLTRDVVRRDRRQRVAEVQQSGRTGRKPRDLRRLRCKPDRGEARDFDAHRPRSAWAREAGLRRRTDPVDLGELLGRAAPLGGGDVLLQLLHRGDAGDHAGDAGPGGEPAHGELAGGCGRSGRRVRSSLPTLLQLLRRGERVGRPVAPLRQARIRRETPRRADTCRTEARSPAESTA